MVRLEKIMKVNEDYYDIYAKDEIIIASVCNFHDTKKSHYHILDQDGHVIKGLGKNYKQKKPKILFANLNPVDDGLGTADPVRLLGDLVTFPVQKLYDSVTYPLIRHYADNLLKKKDYIFSSPDACIGRDNKIYVADNFEVRPEKFSYRKMRRNHIAIFDRSGNGIKKNNISKTVSEHSHRDRIGRIKSFEDKLYVLTNIHLNHTILELDDCGEFIRKVPVEDVIINRDHFEVNQNGIYSAGDVRYNRIYQVDNKIHNIDWYGKLTVHDVKDQIKNAIYHIDWDGKATIYDVGDRIKNSIQGFAIGDGCFYLREGNNIYTYDSNMKHKSTDMIKELPKNEFFDESHRSCTKSMAYDKGHLYLSVRGFTCHRSRLNDDGTYSDYTKEGDAGIFKLSVE